MYIMSNLKNHGKPLYCEEVCILSCIIHRMLERERENERGEDGELG